MNGPTPITTIQELGLQISEFATTVNVRFDSLKSDISKIKSDVKRIENNVRKIETDVRKIETSVKKIETDVKKMKDDIKVLKRSQNEIIEYFEKGQLNHDLRLTKIEYHPQIS